MYKVLFIILILSFGLTGCKNSDVQKNTENNNTETSRLSSSVNENVSNSNNSNTESNASSKTNLENTSNNSTHGQTTENNNDNKEEPQEKEIAKFTTKIRTKDDNRNNNISITCSTLDGTVVEAGKTFSFCDTVGKATKAKGYEEAKTFTDGKVTYGVGGGNCQVSTTLYNAVLKVNNLRVVERHPHSADVPYVEKGKDAAVATGSYDFRFKNNTGKSIKIYASSSDKEVTITLKEF